MSEQTPWAFHVKVNVNWSRPSSRTSLFQQHRGPTPRTFHWTGRRPEPSSPSLDQRSSGVTLGETTVSPSALSHFSSSSCSAITCCPSETELCGPAHVRSSRCVGHHDAQPSLWIRHTFREAYKITLHGVKSYAASEMYTCSYFSFILLYVFAVQFSCAYEYFLAGLIMEATLVILILFKTSSRWAKLHSSKPSIMFQIHFRFWAHFYLMFCQVCIGTTTTCKPLSIM